MSAGAAREDHARGGAPHPEDDAKPEGPSKVGGPGWKYTGRKAFREFLDDQCTDLAAALTYYSVLAVFPALIAIFSLLGVVGQSQTTIDAVMPVLKQVLGSSGSQTLEPVVTSLATSPGAGLALILGLATALWSASGYVTAFSRAMNRVYEIGEGRPIWKLRPIMLLITLVMVLLVVLVALMLVLSGPAAQAVGDLIGLGSTALAVWSIAKWPVVLILVMLIVAILYYTTPNVKQPKFRWISVGAVIAILVWVLISIAFGLYIANFSSYGSTYGSFAGVIIFLLWLWITNLALLFGAEVDAELERSRELIAGIGAERDIQLPVRDDTKIVKDADKAQEDIDQGAALRKSSGRTTDPDET
ncbi:YihY/virulence factor BrkB family protein [Janibacter sp. GS2]|uniref:YihY/virulence factor BrkB family protein n=1 Tax=Janibacter sp. GS2 TaxID=3442646 RepID=UPI003EBD8E9C